VEADLAKFGEAVYRKVTEDAKREQFKGFRAGTVPGHLLPTYRAFAMDETARETVLEALQQNKVKPFDNCRQDMVLLNFSIPPIKKKKKKSKKRKKPADAAVPKENPEEGDVWLSFPTMDEALKAGWKPGQSFSFEAHNVKGQQVGDSMSAISRGSQSINTLKNLDY